MSTGDQNCGGSRGLGHADRGIGQQVAQSGRSCSSQTSNTWTQKTSSKGQSVGTVGLIADSALNALARFCRSRSALSASLARSLEV